MILLAAVLAQAELEAALAKARDAEAVLCVAVVDDGPASRETLKALDACPLAGKFIRVSLPAGREAALLGARWAPTVVLLQGRKTPPATAEDEACLKALRGKRMTMQMENVPIEVVASYLHEIAKVKVVVDGSGGFDEKTLSLKETDLPLEGLLRALAAAADGDFAVMDGAVTIAAKARLPELKLKRELDRLFAGRLEGLPEHEGRVAELLRRRIDLDLGGADRVRDAVARLNAALGEEAVQASESVGRAFIRSTRFKYFTGAQILDLIEAEPKYVWYPKGGKVILAEKPELVALGPARIRDFIVASVESDESLLPEGAAREIGDLVLRLGSDEPEEREKAAAALKVWTGRTATAKAVLRRLLPKAGDAEVRTRLEALLEHKRRTE